jgi:hypothetical protein
MFCCHVYELCMADEACACALECDASHQCWGLCGIQTSPLVEAFYTCASNYCL